MIFDAQSYRLIWADAVHSMGVGFMVGFVYQLLSVFLYKNKVAVFIKDVVISVFFTTALFSYCVSFANYKILRWYNVAFALTGRVLFTPAFSHTGHKLLCFVSMTVKKWFLRLCGKFLAITEKNKEKKLKNTQKNKSEVLKTEEVLLYN